MNPEDITGLPQFVVNILDSSPAEHDIEALNGDDRLRVYQKEPRVTDAGTAILNGMLFQYGGLNDGKAFYSGRVGDESYNIIWIADPGQWWIVPDGESSPAYSSDSDVDFPWLALVDSWEVGDFGDEPAPTELQIAVRGYNATVDEITAAASIPYDLAAQVVGAPGSSAVVLRFIAVRAFTLLAAGQRGTAGTAATAQTDFIVAVNGVTKATLRFAAAGVTISVVGGTAATIAAGDIITITAPASADGTLADIGFTLTGTLL